MFLKAALNGGRRKADHPHVPVTAHEIAADVRAALAAGADVVHAHARDRDGMESIAPGDVAALIEAIRTTSPAAIIGTTTGLWTCDHDHDLRCAAIRAWPVLPDFASVAFSEPGAADAAVLVLERGMELESAVWSVDDVPALLASPTLEHNIRILIEPTEDDPVSAVDHARTMAKEIAAAGVNCPLLYHGSGPTAWPVLRAAAQDGAQLRIGFEDVTTLPDGAPAATNADLIRAARQLSIAAERDAAR